MHDAVRGKKKEGRGSGNERGMMEVRGNGMGVSMEMGRVLVCNGFYQGHIHIHPLDGLA